MLAEWRGPSGKSHPVRIAVGPVFRFMVKCPTCGAPLYADREEGPWFCESCAQEGLALMAQLYAPCP
jgi:ribosomal protein L37AE/L43A